MMAICFATGNNNASYHSCEDKLVTKSQTTLEMASMDCADMMADAQPQKSEPKCCIAFSCSKCFSSSLATAQQETIAAPLEHAALVRENGYPVASHLNSDIDRPPKNA